MNIGRSHSIRSKGASSDSHHVPKHRFAMASLRGIQQPELSKRLYKLIKTENHAISAHENASREGQSVASQLSDWGESTEDEGVSDISDKLGVLLAEIAEQEDLYAQGLEESRGVLKVIRNTEQSVQPSRNQKQKIQDEIAKLKYKEPESTKLVQLEQELVRAEAQSLVAEAQLTNITRQKFKEAFDLHTAAILERAEKQILLATQARRLVSMLDDTPTVPGEERAAYTRSEDAREVLNEAEAELRSWKPGHDKIPSQSTGALGANAMPSAAGSDLTSPTGSSVRETAQQRVERLETAQEHEGTAGTSYVPSANVEAQSPPYPTEHATVA
ncbi:hypothetical protein K431DRAFT_286073 [Polychaeton citri CBS 116435]|uniref:Sphingolipid long chain base-responsive protein LSP1 n=1 Tax=Polychaeton citri CBS 116435 TaxID=1314669 RepID=A0A9P4Q5A9_9PEZI|nr:hypothetical protein K431DRAFT_286073 [Polychaeton citri CBS 116435]